MIRVPAALLLVSLTALSALDARAEEGADRFRIDFGLYLQGRHVYERNCIVCHGERGDGQGEMSRDMFPKPRSFREGWFKFRSTPWDKMPTEADLRRTITGGLSGTSMGMFTHLRDEEVTAVIAYVKSFSRRWRKAENHADPVPLPPPPPWLAASSPPSGRIASGRQLFTTHCAACHGELGTGDGPAAAGLLDAWGLPDRPSDLTQPHLRCGDSAADVFRVLATGLNGTPMTSFAGILDEDSRWELAAYVLSLRQ